MIKPLGNRNDIEQKLPALCTTNLSANLTVFTESSISYICQSLRYDYFVVKRGWVEVNEAGINCETDRYDAHSCHLSVFDGEHLLAYVRALPYRSDVGFMLDSEFSPVLSNASHHGLEREGAVELSRFVVSPLMQDKRNDWRIHPVEYLLKALYHFARERDYSRFYIVVEAGWPQVFARRFGLPFQVIGDPYAFPDGTRTVAATATLAELEAGMRRHSLAKYEWYQRNSDACATEGLTHE